MPAITPSNDDAQDFTARLDPNQHLWLTVGNASLYIKLTEERGVLVEVYARGREDETPLSIAAAHPDDLLPNPEN